MSGEWLDLFLATLANNPKRLGGYILEYPKGITQFALQEAEKKLGFEIPTQLGSLLLEFDGIHEYVIDKGEKLRVGSIIWDLSNMVEWHLSWTVPEKRKLFCFGSSVLGNCFGYLLVEGKPNENEIWEAIMKPDRRTS